jgi:hypothetical protein
MSKRVEQILKQIPMYERAEDAGTLPRLHDTVVHELHTELDGLYGSITDEEKEADIKELEIYLSGVKDDHHKKQLLHEIIAYIEEKL